MNLAAVNGVSTPYQNYGHVYLFNNRKLQLSKTKTISLDADTNFDGAIQGMASRVYYFSYALTYSEIQTLLNVGPSTTMDSPDMSISPYLADTWWTNQQTSTDANGNPKVSYYM
jgi:hypothetical protein